MKRNGTICLYIGSGGTPYFSTVFNSVLENEVAPHLEKIKLLSRSEITIVKLIAHGNSSIEIGEQLSISTRTVEKHRSNIISKLNLSQEKEILAIWAREYSSFFL